VIVDGPYYHDAADWDASKFLLYFRGAKSRLDDAPSPFFMIVRLPFDLQQRIMETGELFIDVGGHAGVELGEHYIHVKRKPDEVTE
jgi:hypothetical protein